MMVLLDKKPLVYLFGIVIFFAFSHYSGYVLDAVLYLLQTVNYLHPERFVNDVPFMFGNQDSFSIYSPSPKSVFW